VWRHGDWVTVTDQGSLIIHGRSDATLNRNGIRMGSADIYEVVEGLDEAIDHINRFGSRHTDAIVSAYPTAAERFAARVDTAVAVVNASTRYNDGGELGLGAEIGISTDKLHARGPCGTRELTTYKYVVTGTGQTRS
jgi:glutamate-5-semialdehyde dehydrogenase